MIKLRGLNNWKAKSDAMKKRVRVSATEHVKAKVWRIYLDALRVSPQWSGNYAYNWAIDINKQPSAYSKAFKEKDWAQLARDRKVKYAGHPDAINAAMTAERDTIELIKWNSDVRLVNHAPVAELIESGKVNLRPENLVPGGEGVMAYLKAKYKFTL